MRAQEATARSYAKALFALARERNQADAVAGELHTLVSLVAGEPGFAAFLGRPWVGAAAKRQAAAEIATQLGVSALARDFLALVAANGRADHLAAIGAAYRGLLDADQRRVRARVRTAVALGDEQRGALARRLARALAGRQGGAPVTVLVEEVVDEGLLGGFVAEVGSLIVDGSLDGQLARLRQRLVTG